MRDFLIFLPASILFSIHIFIEFCDFSSVLSKTPKTTSNVCFTCVLFLLSILIWVFYARIFPAAFSSFPSLFLMFGFYMWSMGHILWKFNVFKFWACSEGISISFMKRVKILVNFGFLGVLKYVANRLNYWPVFFLCKIFDIYHFCSLLEFYQV